MLRVTFDIVPAGIESHAKTIGVMELCNLKTREDGTADYAVVMKKCAPFKGALQEAWKRGTVTAQDHVINAVIAGEDDEMIAAFVSGHHRTKRGVYDLLFRALKACGLDRRNKDAADG